MWLLGGCYGTIISDGSQVFLYEGISTRACRMISNGPGMIHFISLSSQYFIMAVTLRRLSLSI